MTLFDYVRDKANEAGGKFNTNDKNDKIFEFIEAGKPVTITHPTSMRSYSRGRNGLYSSGSFSISGQGTKAKLASTAIAEIQYDPSTEICKVKYQPGNGNFYDFRMTVDEFKRFMNAPSKGRYVQTVMKIHNRI